MTDILILQERIKNSILVGESDFREFKSALEGKSENAATLDKKLQKRSWWSKIITNM